LTQNPILMSSTPECLDQAAPRFLAVVRCVPAFFVLAPLLVVVAWRCTFFSGAAFDDFAVLVVFLVGLAALSDFGFLADFD
jgi:hypothetical protein